MTSPTNDPVEGCDEKEASAMWATLKEKWTKVRDYENLRPRRAVNKRVNLKPGTAITLAIRGVPNVRHAPRNYPIEFHGLPDTLVHQWYIKGTKIMLTLYNNVVRYG